jgi:hypothetical protein
VARAIPRALACGDLKYRYILMPMNLTEKIEGYFCQKHHMLAKWPAYGVFLRVRISVE